METEGIIVNCEIAPINGLVSTIHQHSNSHILIWIDPCSFLREHCMHEDNVNKQEKNHLHCQKVMTSRALYDDPILCW
jgi:hypothetical protein